MRTRYRTINWSQYNAALKTRGSLTIWLDRGMRWLAEPSGKRGRGKLFSDAAIAFCLSIKCLFNQLLRQALGMVQSLLQLARLDWPVPDLQHRLPSPKDSAGRNRSTCCSTAQASNFWVKANANARSTAPSTAAHGARCTSGSMRRRWRYALSKSPATPWGTHPWCPSCWHKSQTTSLSPVSVRTVRMTRGGALMRLPSEGRKP